MHAGFGTCLPPPRHHPPHRSAWTAPPETLPRLASARVRGRESVKVSVTIRFCYKVTVRVTITATVSVTIKVAVRVSYKVTFMVLDTVTIVRAYLRGRAIIAVAKPVLRVRVSVSIRVIVSPCTRLSVRATLRAGASGSR